MSTNPQPQDPLPEEARAALQNRGGHLLAQLEAMRSDAAGLDSELPALDPQAALALRRSGDALLGQLETQRAALASAEGEPVLEPVHARPRWAWRRGAGIAAAFAGLLAAAQVNTTPPEESIKPQVGVKQRKDDPATYTAVPEPSSALLGIVGASFLLYRRRR